VIAEFEVKLESRDDGVQVVSVVGELDAATAPQLDDALGKALGTGGPILIDLSDCSFIDSTGLGVVVSGRARAREQDQRFELCCAADQARRILEITGLDDAFGLYETRDDALAAIVA
jgi:anti-anti-sigma factor